jgi:hypothetical protein
MNAPTPVQVRLAPEQIARLDEWRRRQKDKPSRPEALRRLIEMAVEGTFGTNKAPKAK